MKKERKKIKKTVEVINKFDKSRPAVTRDKTN